MPLGLGQHLARVVSPATGKGVNLAPILRLVGALLAGALAGGAGASKLAPVPVPVVCPPCPELAPVNTPPLESTLPTEG